MACAERRALLPRGLRTGLAAAALAAATGAALAQVDPSPARVAPNPALPVLPAPESAATSRWTPASMARAFGEADADGNAELSRAEAVRLAFMPGSFEELDANRDGVLTLAEYQAGAP